MISIKNASLLSLLVFMLACDKGDLNGSSSIAGRLFFIDTLTGDGIAKPLAAKTVSIGYSGQGGSNFLFNAKTDAEGYFSFSNLNHDSTYRLIYEETITDIIQTADTSLQLELNKERQLVFVAMPNLKKQTLLRLKIQDINGHPIPDVRNCVFSSLLLANNSLCDGKVFELSSNSKGLAFRYNVPAGTYHINSRGIYGSLTLNGMARNFLVKPVGISEIGITVN